MPRLPTATPPQGVRSQIPRARVSHVAQPRRTPVERLGGTRDHRDPTFVPVLPTPLGLLRVPPEDCYRRLRGVRSKRTNLIALEENRPGEFPQKWAITKIVQLPPWARDCPSPRLDIA